MRNDPGEVVYRKSARCLRLQREALAKQRALFDGDPQPDSPASFDRDALSGRSKRSQARRWILDEMIRQAGRITSSAADHMLGLQKCMESQPEAQFCTMTLSRGVLDAATRVCYLLDPAITLETRLVRGSALLLDSSEEEMTAVRALPPLEAPMPEAQKVVTSIRDNVQGWITLAGMDIRSGPKRRPDGIAWDTTSKQVPLKVNVSSESARYFPDVPAAYRMASGWPTPCHGCFMTPTIGPARYSWRSRPRWRPCRAASRSARATRSTTATITAKRKTWDCSAARPLA